MKITQRNASIWARSVTTVALEQEAAAQPGGVEIPGNCVARTQYGWKRGGHAACKNAFERLWQGAAL